jgi:serine phosphatase RsbU (regulator of sigma subunit)
MKKPVILCVDDEKVVLDSLKTELKDSFGNNYSIETAENGSEALEIVNDVLQNDHEIPLIISDYIMPNIKGDELLKEVHTIMPKTLKILLTGQATLEGVTNSINNANLYRYISKPWEPKDMKLTVNEAIKSYQQAKQLEEQNKLLKELNQALEIKVQERTAEIQQKNIILEEQKNQLFLKNENITASINYAKRIQQALLPSKELFKEAFPESFILYKPKDIVSGDFYWIASFNPYGTESCNAADNPVTLVAVADCTGHGVPGALMSMLGMSFLSEIIQSCKKNLEEITSACILEQLRGKVKTALKQTGKTDETKDGMDIALCVVDRSKNTLQYSGAFNPMFIIRNSDTSPELIEIKPDRMPIGIYYFEKENFTNNNIDLKPNDAIYLFSDGYVDQFGGVAYEKIKIKNFRQILLKIAKEPMAKQHEHLKNYFINWRNHHDQIDDVTVVGFRY